MWRERKIRIVGCEEIRIVGCGERYRMWAVETVDRDKEHGLWRLLREIRNVGCEDCRDIRNVGCGER